MTRWLLSFLLAVSVARAADPMPSVHSGTVERMPLFASRFVEPRNVDVWLPPGFDRSRSYRVIYLHDGQMLFDPATTWNKRAWEIDRHASGVIARGAEPFILVGIWNAGPLRFSEYFPEKALPFLPDAFRRTFVEKALAGKPRADAYLRFLVEELMPEIARRYPVKTGPENTAIMGSSMGGLISLYAVCEYPGVFGAAAGLSTHWIGTFDQNATVPLALFRYLQGHLPDPSTHRLYLDHGTVGLDALYGPHQAFADILIRDAGYTGDRLESRVFAGANHDETSWSDRVEIPLTFLEQPRR